MNGRFLSVVMPCYNERAHVAEIVRRVSDQPMVLEIVIVDDLSKDGTREELARLAKENPLVRVILHERNRGKGAALRTGFAVVRGEVALVQDADLEYDPSDYTELVRPIRERGAQVVYGSRYLRHRKDSAWHILINKGLTLLSNIMTRQHLTDMETCYKVIRTDVLRRLVLRQDRFGCDPEITAEIARQRVMIREVPVSYSPRTYAQGKKIRWTDGFRAVEVILRHGLPGL